MTITAKNQLAASVVVLSDGVEVQIADTFGWFKIQNEAVLSIGDVIRTNDEGRAIVTFFENGISTELTENTVYRIDEFAGDEDEFTIRATVLLGITRQQINKIIDAGSSYELETPAVVFAARGTVFDIRVEENDRSAMVVTEGLVDVNSRDAQAEVPVGFGIRSKGTGLSEVVRAASFDELDSILDGCTLENISLQISGDVSLNVRNMPNLSANVIGYIAPSDLTRIVGQVTGTAWYRIPLQDEFGWVYLENFVPLSGCEIIRQFDISELAE